jgi:hypothetical protein
MLLLGGSGGSSFFAELSFEELADFSDALVGGCLAAGSLPCSCANAGRAAQEIITKRMPQPMEDQWAAEEVVIFMTITVQEASYEVKAGTRVESEDAGTSFGGWATKLEPPPCPDLKIFL